MPTDMAKMAKMKIPSTDNDVEQTERSVHC